MAKVANRKMPLPAPVALTDDIADMAAYSRSAAGRAAIERGRSEIAAGRSIEGAGALARELVERAARRRKP